MGKNFWQALTGTRYRYGYACVNFGEPLSLKQWIAEQSDGAAPHPVLNDVEPLANVLMDRIGDITPILPVALVASVFTQNQSVSLNQLALKSHVHRLLQKLDDAGYRAYIPRSDVDYAITVGVRMLNLRGILIEKNGELVVNKNELTLLNYYSNSIKHLVDRLQLQEQTSAQKPTNPELEEASG